ncbi:hypothetical protein [Luteimonas arsenica]|uniref:hypothetical protein n=1 Tax=Luteimonas arsenica TaxID=1586242 RepID=UPI0010552FA9|nr:hypothetical protein [Luteimonas arsenica]
MTHRTQPFISPKERRTSILLAIGTASAALLLLAKAWLNLRLNINWDEFYFLSKVHAHYRGELATTFQTIHVQFFGWLLDAAQTEVNQIVLARLALLALLATNCFLVWKIACNWMQRHIATIAPVAHLSMLPVAHHGASFRTDSIILPLISLSILMLIGESRRRSSLIVSGLALGLAGAISVKSAFVVPILVAALLLGNKNGVKTVSGPVTKATFAVSALAFISLATFLTIIALHSLDLPRAPNMGEHLSLYQQIVQAVDKTLVEPTLSPRSEFILPIIQADTFYWLLFAVGLVFALAKRQGLVACMGLALFPVLLYRNAFPYYYVVMLSTASILVAYAVHSLTEQFGKTSNRLPRAMTLVAFAFFTLNGLSHIKKLSPKTLDGQRDILEAVHEIFPEPVGYVDHSGMVSSFPKMNPFMSSWGVENYHRAGIPFMPQAINRGVPLLLANRFPIDSDLRFLDRLLPEDQKMILSSYVRYWGPIYVAGANLPSSPGQVSIPFPGEYRLESSHPVLMNGISVVPNQTFLAISTTIEVVPPEQEDDATPARLVWAGARAPPQHSPPRDPLYVPLMTAFR